MQKEKKIHKVKHYFMHILKGQLLVNKFCLFNCSVNICFQVLLGLSDSELDSALDLKSALHRRKLRLAIEEYRDPTNM